MSPIHFAPSELLLAKSVRIILVFLYIWLSLFTSFAQTDIPIGTWRTHFNYTNVKMVISAPGEKKVYAATENALFYIDEEDNSINKITKLDGLSDVGISALKHQQGVLSIGYIGGTVDFITGREISAFSTLTTAPQLEDKTINDILIYQNRAYLATNIGVVLVNLSNNIIIESYTEIGPSAGTVAVKSMQIWQDSLFLATPTGLLAAPLNTNLNLLDFANWKTIPLPTFSEEIFSIAALDNELWVHTSQGLWAYSFGKWASLTDNFSPGVVTKLKATSAGVRLIIRSPENQYHVINEALNTIFSTTETIHDVTTASGILYLATQRGLLSVQGANIQNLTLAGPPSDDITNLQYTNQGVYAFPSASNNQLSPRNMPASYGLFREASWETNTIPNFTDITAVTDNSQYFSSFGSGIYESATQAIITHETIGSPLMAGSPPAAGPQISAIRMDKTGDLWVANFDAMPSLHKLKPTGDWESIVLGASQNVRFPVDLHVSQSTGTVWVQLSTLFGGGAYVHDPTQSQSLFISRSSHNLPSNNVRTIAIDQNDEVWVGTDEGVSYFPSSITPFSNNFNQSILPNVDGTPLLRGERVTKIAIDGGNRKWIGTTTGLWLFTSNGDELIDRFTTTNSPIPSNEVLDIAINDENGEVFVSTTRGLVSYRSGATFAEKKFDKVEVFPNPITPDYQGTIGIRGLAANANVKITDVSGNLVREINANGGTATWDGLDLFGRKVASGVYLVLGSLADGSEYLAGKFAVIR